MQQASGAGLPTGNADRSVEMWFKTADPSHQVLAWWGTDAPDEEMELGINNADEIYWTGEYNGADFTASTSFADGRWHHLVLTYAGASLTVTAYLDGQSVGADQLGSAWNTTLDGTGLTVGGPQYQGYFLNCAIDEFAVYDTVLPAARVDAHYAAASLAATTYGYDAAGQLISQSSSGAPATTYTYDNLGRRATATTAGVVTTFRYDDAGELCWMVTGATMNTNTSSASALMDFPVPSVARADQQHSPTLPDLEVAQYDLPSYVSDQQIDSWYTSTLPVGTRWKGLGECVGGERVNHPTWSGGWCD